MHHISLPICVSMVLSVAACSSSNGDVTSSTPAGGTSATPNSTGTTLNQGGTYGTTSRSMAAGGATSSSLNNTSDNVLPSSGGSTGSTPGSRIATGGVVGSSTSVGRSGSANGGTSEGGAAGAGKAFGGTQSSLGRGGSKASAGGSSSTTGAVNTGGRGTFAGAPSTGGNSTTGGTTTGAAGASPWPQCFANDTVPTAALKQRAATSDYATQVAYGGVAMIIGPQRQACLTDALVQFDVEDLNGEIKDVVETLQFPGFLDWKRGYYMNWVILNSGIPGATISGQGGHQGDRYGHMNFESSEECPCKWGTGDDSNRGNALHESIHALQAELWAFNNEASGWIHEAHNCYLGTQRAHFVENKYTMGWGAALTLQMPHAPIESMGLLTDDTVAGPSDQLASGKTYVNSIVRYGLEIFFLSLNLEMGRGFVNCLWIDGSKKGNPEKRVSSPLSVFQALQSYAGAEGTAHAVMSFGARSAILDFGGWTAIVRSTLQGNWNNSYWFYMFPGGDGTTAFRPIAKQVPHHQGRNIVPIKLNAGSTSVTVEFTPDAKGSKGTTEHMQAQLVYRDSADQPVYGTVFADGQSTIQVPNGARNGIVNLVVAVTNPNADSGGDDNSNKGFDGQEHFSYQARIVSGGSVAPTTTRPW